MPDPFVYAAGAVLGGFDCVLFGFPYYLSNTESSLSKRFRHAMYSATL
jgi:hypothetical protein